MNNNFYDIPVDWYKEFNNSFNVTNNNELATPKEGLIKGNLFNNLFEPYKNYQPGDLKPINNKQELLYNILKYKFALIELDLYLDIYPNNKEMINLYNKYLFEEKKLCEEYEKKYDILTLSSNYLEGNSWKWLDSPWPWEEVR